MLVDDSIIKEAVDIFEDSFEKMSQADEIKKAARANIKSWAEGKNIDKTTATEVFNQFSAWKKGRLRWGEEDDDKEDYTSLLIAVMDEATGTKR